MQRENSGTERLAFESPAAYLGIQWISAFAIESVVCRDEPSRPTLAQRSWSSTLLFRWFAEAILPAKSAFVWTTFH